MMNRANGVEPKKNAQNIKIVYHATLMDMVFAL